MTEWYESIEPSEILNIDGQKLYLGNIGNTRALHKNGNPLGIQAVLDVSTDDDYERRPGVRYLRVPFHDGLSIPAECFEAGMKFLKQCWEEKLTILVNCHAGISRSTSMVCSFIYSTGLWTTFNPALDTLEKILAYVSRCRPIVLPAPSTFRSCKKHLKLWPYDGSLGDAEPPAERMDKLTFAALMKVHKNRDCPVRQSILNNDDTERHLLHCTCGLEL